MSVLLYLAIPAAGTLITGHILTIIWGRRSVDPRLLPFWLLILSILIWSAGYLAEMISPALQTKIFWAQVQYFGIAFVSPLWFIFIVSYMYSTRWLKRPVLILLSIIPLLTILLVWTNGQHGLIWSDYQLVEPLGYPVVAFEHGPAFWVYWAYSYLMMVMGLLLLILAVRRSQAAKMQNAVLITAGVLPWLGNLIYVTNANRSQLDFTLLGFVLSGGILFWALFRHHFLDILPIAHRMILHSLSDPVLVFDTADCLIDFNPVAQQLFNTLAQQPIGKHLNDIFVEHPAVIEKLQTTNTENEPLTTIYLYSKAHYHIHIEPLYTKSQKKIGRVLVLRDITDHIQYQTAIKIHNAELKTLNQQLKAALQQAKAANQAKEQFLAATSHDLRTPIANIMLYLSLLEKRPDKSADYIETLKHETLRMKAQIDDLLDMARFEQKAVTLNTTSLDLNALLLEYANDRAAALEKRQLKLNIDLAPQLPLISADQMLLGRVVGNLLGNAISYTPAGGSILIQTRPQTYEGAQGVQMNICDTGLGIPAEERAKIFERFYRGSQQVDSTEGTGLGLAISQEIVERHLGWIRIDEGPGNYRTQFSVWLPTAHHKATF